MKSVVAVLTLLASIGCLAADAGLCSETTHGIPMKERIKKLDARNAATFTPALGEPQLIGAKDGVTAKVWFDISHYQSGNAQMNSRKDCGFMAAVSEGNGTVKTTVRGLLPEEIDQLLSKTIPSSVF